MIIQRDGWWVPDSDRRGFPVFIGDVNESVGRILTHIKGRNCIVQAGACLGIYPVALADFFQRVVTVEPDPENADCMRKNVKARDTFGRIIMHEAALSDRIGGCKMVEVEPDNCGAHRIDRDGAIPTITIDALGLDHCDAIWLDIEGSELLALQGAIETIDKFSPTIAVEDKGLNAAFGIMPGELQHWLGLFGYQEVDRIGRDKVFRRAS